MKLFLENPLNILYGNDRILREYVGTKLPYVLPGEWEHGWTPQFKDLKDHTLATEKDKLVCHLVHHERQYAQAKAFGYKNIIAVGSPLLYLKTLAAPEPMDKSLILFPSHSGPEFPFFDPLTRFNTYINDIQPLLKVFSPVTVCLNWFDYQNRHTRLLFESKHMETTTVGHRLDPYFLYKFRSLVYQNSYVSSNDLSTAMIYSLHLRRKAFLCGTHQRLDETVFEPNRYCPTTMTKTLATVREEIASSQELYPVLKWEHFDNRAHPEIGDYEVGVVFKRTPKELRELLRWYPANLPRQIQWRNIATSVGSSVLPEMIKAPLRKLVT